MEQVRELVVRAASAATRAERIEAYGRLVELFRDMACGYAYAIVGDFHLAEDVAQEAFILAFDRLAQLRDPGAFPGWFRKIVWTACGRATRRKAVPTTGLAAAAGVADAAGPPDQQAELREMKDEVLKAIRDLPAPEREATTLFYINGYSQKDIADFLEVPVGTVKNRLHASRSRLKERMLNMVRDTLHQNAPDERFSLEVIGRLLDRPNLMEVDGHPVKSAWEAIRDALRHYEVVMTAEVISIKAQPPMIKDRDPGTNDKAAYYLTRDTRLRAYLPQSTLPAIQGRTPPVRLLMPGRVFFARGWRAEPGIIAAPDIKIGHVCHVPCIEKGFQWDTYKVGIQSAIRAVLGDVEIRVGEPDLSNEPTDSPVYGGVTFEIRNGDCWLGVCRGGIFTPELLRQSGYDPENVGGADFGFGLDRLSLARLSTNDIRKLWQPPYLP